MRNKMFLTAKQSVSHRETKSFSQRNQKFFTEKQSVLSVNFFGMAIVCRRDVRPITADNLPYAVDEHSDM